MSEWVAWIEPKDQWGYPYDPPRRYVRSQVPTFRLTHSRGLAARYPTEEQALEVAKSAANPGTPFGVEAVRASGSSLKS